jgi:uncharacterized protein
VIAGLVLLGGGAAAGMFGSLLGLGGGVLIVPLLTLGLGLPLREAVAVSLVSVIVTSSAGAGVYLRRHVANLRLGMVLELFTSTGALVGGLVAFALPSSVLEGLFALLLTWVAITMARASLVRRGRPSAATEPAGLDETEPTSDETEPATAADLGPPASAAASARLPEPAAPLAGPDAGDFTGRLSGPGYRVGRLRFGAMASLGAGVVSALLGVGGGIIKVPVMNLAMGVPLKVATATSNMMIGITATSSAIIYLLRGEIDPYIAGPTALGVYVGASLGARVAQRIDVRLLRLLFVLVLGYTALQMGQRALGL